MGMPVADLARSGGGRTGELKGRRVGSVGDGARGEGDVGLERPGEA